MATRDPFYPNQIVPLVITGVVFLAGTGLLYLLILGLNLLPLSREHIVTRLQPLDLVVGITIYLKTSIDFAIFIGRLMHKYPGWKNRIAIEIGTAMGNILGTLVILVIWDIFREIRLLMAGMIILASLVLLRLAEDGLEHAKDESGKYNVSFFGLEIYFERILDKFNRLVAPVLTKLIPHSAFATEKVSGFWGLFALSFSVPFILGSDDFAGYISLFNVVNIFGFATGIFFGHMILNIALFLSPDHTVKAVKHPVISFLGSLVFVGLAIWGLSEALHLLF